jgi:serine/threonine protein kinase
MVSTSRPDERLGTVLQDRYRITTCLAAGAMGVVYRAERVGLGRPVAIKFLREGAASPAELRRRFAIEARAASRMNHPNCVPVIDFGTDRDIPYIVMELVAGQTLRELLTLGALAVPRALAIARQVLAGLAHAHAHGVVHRDIKPENILVWSDAMGEHVQITDFGLAKLDSLAVSQKIAIGTPSYMSPEQTLGMPVDVRSDVYSTGILLFELLAVQKPFKGRHPFETMRLQREARIPTFEAVAPERLIPTGVEGVVRRALAKEREERYACAVDLAEALERALDIAREDSDDVAVAELLALSSRTRWLPGIGFIIAVAMIAVAGWVSFEGL